MKKKLDRECNICSETTSKVFSKTLLNKHNVDYFQCNNCDFLQTEEPYWLNEAYNDGAIGALDVGIMSRNQSLSKSVSTLLNKMSQDVQNIKVLDYGGGHGIFVRLMRDLGYDFFRQDLYAPNLYARYFDIENVQKDTKFDFLTAFEVFEHLVDPLKEIELMFKHSDVIIFSTELQPSSNIASLDEWWYIVPEGGQHVSFYNQKSLKIIAEKFNAKFFTNSRNLHVLSKRNLQDPFQVKSNQHLKEKNLLIKIAKRILNRKSHLRFETSPVTSKIQSDFSYIKEIIKGDEQ